ncbi:MAG: type II secretion system GspH family protein [Lentisphaeraceae bacterium]|nr:type II secretion system GspH family protein [Lentisphaeraceae bacterium]
MSKVKFTMIELLVVLAILGLLVSILLPSLVQAREKARVAVCMSNNKNIFTAVSMYNKNNGGFYPYKLSGTMYAMVGKWTWYRPLGANIRPVNEYLGEFEERDPVPIAQCPSVDYAYERWGSSYASNSFIGDIKGINNNDYTGKHVAQIENPSRLVAFAETGSFHPGWNLRVVPIEELYHSSRENSRFVVTITDGRVAYKKIKLAMPRQDDFTFDDRN